MSDTIKYVAEEEFQRIEGYCERRCLEAFAEIIGQVTKYQYLAANSTGIQRQIYLKEQEKLENRLKASSLFC